MPEAWKNLKMEAKANPFYELSAGFIFIAKKLAGGRTQTVPLAKAHIFQHENKL